MLYAVVACIVEDWEDSSAARGLTWLAASQWESLEKVGDMMMLIHMEDIGKEDICLYM